MVRVTSFAASAVASLSAAPPVIVKASPALNAIGMLGASTKPRPFAGIGYLLAGIPEPATGTFPVSYNLRYLTAALTFTAMIEMIFPGPDLTSVGFVFAA